MDGRKVFKRARKLVEKAIAGKEVIRRSASLANASGFCMEVKISDYLFLMGRKWNKNRPTYISYIEQLRTGKCWEVEDLVIDEENFEGTAFLGLGKTQWNKFALLVEEACS